MGHVYLPMYAQNTSSVLISFYLNFDMGVCVRLSEPDLVTLDGLSLTNLSVSYSLALGL